jgi:hypothetical protein
LFFPRLAPRSADDGMPRAANRTKPKPLLASISASFAFVPRISGARSSETCKTGLTSPLRASLAWLIRSLRPRQERPRAVQGHCHCPLEHHTRVLAAEGETKRCFSRGRGRQEARNRRNWQERLEEGKSTPSALFHRNSSTSRVYFSSSRRLGRLQKRGRRRRFNTCIHNPSVSD